MGQSLIPSELLARTYAYESLASILDPLPKSSKLLTNPAMVAQEGFMSLWHKRHFGVIHILTVFNNGHSMDIYSP